MSVTERKRASTRRHALLGGAEGAFATARYVRIAPMKARRVVDLIRGSNADQALSVLRFSPQAAAVTVFKLLESAVSNATTVEGLQRDSLVVTQAFVDEGPTLKRFRPRAQGRAYRIRKRTSHITVVVQPAAVENGRAR
jgi:large subunit ribosomal protein L22